MSALAASTLINIHRKPGSKVMAPLDFWEQPKSEADPEQIVAILEAANAQREKMRGRHG